MKTIFITGASAGLGKATAILFQSKGWRVIATMRNPEKESELTKLENIILLPLDVTNAEQVNKTVQIALDLADIDVVFNNAGYGLAGAFEAYSDKQIVKQINTNFLGVLRVAKPFVSYFRENSKEALFITTTSSAGIAASPLSSVYSATKFALEGWSEAMNYDTSSFGIIFKTIAPGGISTGFGTKSLDVALHPAYEPLWNRMMEGFRDGTLIHFSTPESIAQVVYQAATDGKQQLRYPAGPDAVETDRLRQELGLQSHSDQIRNLYSHKS